MCIVYILRDPQPFAVSPRDRRHRCSFLLHHRPLLESAISSTRPRKSNLICCKKSSQYTVVFRVLYLCKAYQKKKEYQGDAAKLSESHQRNVPTLNARRMN